MALECQPGDILEYKSKEASKDNKVWLINIMEESRT
jgi:hypothetical protein